MSIKPVHKKRPATSLPNGDSRKRRPLIEHYNIIDKSSFKSDENNSEKKMDFWVNILETDKYASLREFLEGIDPYKHGK